MSAPNIAIVVLDTLRRDSFDKHFQWLPGARFDRAFSTSQATVPAHASIWSGEHPDTVNMSMGSRHRTISKPVLPELLKEAGYRTQAWSANTNIAPQFGWHRGFDEFDGFGIVGEADLFNWNDFINNSRDEGLTRFVRALKEIVFGDCATLRSIQKGIGLKLGVDSNNQKMGAVEALEWLSSHDFKSNSEFVFLNLMEAHCPYWVPDEYQSISPVERTQLRVMFEGFPEGTEHARQAYEDCVAYLSEMYEQMFDILQEEFDIIITVSDHGEAFGEYGVYQHGYGIQPELVHIPLSVWTRKGEYTNSQNSAPISIQDIYLTINEESHGDERSTGNLLSDEARSETVRTLFQGIPESTQRKLRNSDWFTDFPSKQKIPELTERRIGVADANGYVFESRDGLIETHGNVSDSLRKELKRVELDTPVEDVDEDIDDAVKDRLAELGYV